MKGCAIRKGKHGVCGTRRLDGFGGIDGINDRIILQCLSGNQEPAVNTDPIAIQIAQIVHLCLDIDAGVFIIGRIACGTDGLDIQIQNIFIGRDTLG